MSRTPRVAVVGFPNVGKSTLVNRLSGGREAVVHSEAGVTRDRKELPCSWNGRDFILIDTGGLDFEAGDQISRAIQEQARAAIADADVVALVLDAKAGLRQGDAEVAEILRRADVPVVIVANKVDGPSDEPQVADLYSLGLGDPVGVSAAQGRSTGDLLDRLVAALPAPDPDAEDEADRPRLALIGRPERRQVLAGQSLPGLGPCHRLRDRRDDARRDRHRAQGGRPLGAPDRHGRPSQALACLRLGRVLRADPLGARRGAG